MMKNLKMPPELKGLKLADRLQSSENIDVNIITGNDYYGELITGKVIKTENGAWIAMESKFRWLPSGPIHNENIYTNDLNTLCQRIKILPVEESKQKSLLKKFWEINKNTGIKRQNDEIIVKL